MDDTFKVTVYGKEGIHSEHSKLYLEFNKKLENTS